METSEKILLGMEPTTFLQGGFSGGRRQVERLEEGGTERRTEGEKVTLWSFSALSHSVSTYELWQLLVGRNPQTHTRTHSARSFSHSLAGTHSSRMLRFTENHKICSCTAALQSAFQARVWPCHVTALRVFSLLSSSSNHLFLPSLHLSLSVPHWSSVHPWPISASAKESTWLWLGGRYFDDTWPASPSL